MGVPPEQGTPNLSRRLSRDAVRVLLVRVLGVLAAFGLNAVVARILEPADFGRFLLVLSVAIGAAHLGELGLPEIVTRLVARAVSLGRGEEARAAVRASARLMAATTVATTALIVSPAVRGLLGRLLDVGDVMPVALAITALVGLRAAQLLCAEAFRGLGRVTSAMLLDGAAANAVAAVAVTSLALWGGRMSLTHILAVIAAAGCVPVVLASVSLSRQLAALAPGPAASPPPGLVQDGLPNMVKRVALFLSGQVDAWIVAILLTAHDVAIYGAALRVLLLVMTPLVVVNQIVPSLVAAEDALGRRDRLQQALRAAATVASIPAACMVLVVVAAGQPLMGLVFGSEYRPAAGALAILAVGQLVSTGFGPGGMTLLGTGHQRILMWISVVAGALAVPLLLALGRLGGIQGVALGMSVVGCAQAAAMWWCAHRCAGVWTHVGAVRFPSLPPGLRTRMPTGPSGERKPGQTASLALPSSSEQTRDSTKIPAAAGDCS